MPPNVTPDPRDYREREGGKILYPVHSRRSGGLSLGVDLFGAGKKCSFDCPYCEVFPFPAGQAFEIGRLEAEFAAFFRETRAREFPGTPLRDICLSGSGEPTLSPHLEEALYAMAAARGRYCPEAELVVITNGTGFASASATEALERFVRKVSLKAWVKLDAGTESWYRTMNRGALPYGELLAGIERYALLHPLTIQTMVCEVEGRAPDGGEVAAYASRLATLLDKGAEIEQVQIYTQARPAPEGSTAPVPDRVLVEIAQRVREITQGRVPVRTYGAR
jgi:histidinol dehydrogenase